MWFRGMNWNRVPETILELYPGQSYQMDTMILNKGNGPDRFDITIASIVDDSGVSRLGYEHPQDLI